MASLLSFNIKSATDIMELVNSDTRVKELVTGLQKLYFPREIKNDIEDLQRISGLFQLAYIGSAGFPCHAPVEELMSKYQALLANTSRICGNFNLFKTSFKCHQLALQHLEGGDSASALAKMKESSALVGSIVMGYEQLRAESKTLWDEAKKTLLAIQHDVVPLCTRMRDLEKREEEGKLSSADSLDKETLKASISSLDNATKPAGPILSTIANTWLFWSGSLNYSERLGDISIIEGCLGCEMMEDAKREIEQSNICWMGLAGINHTIDAAIQQTTAEFANAKS